MQPDHENRILVQVDKTVVQITGLNIKGLRLQDLEDVLKLRLGALVRIIGVTGKSIEMDVYGLDADAILKDRDGIIRAVALCDGITADDVVQMNVEQIQSIDIDHLEPVEKIICMKQRWLP